MSRSELKRMVEDYNEFDEDEEAYTPPEPCPLDEFSCLNLYQCEQSTKKGMADQGAFKKLHGLNLTREVGKGYQITNEGKLFLDKWYDRRKLRLKKFKRRWFKKDKSYD